MTARPLKWSVVTLSLLTASYLQTGEALADSTNPLGALQGTLNQVATQTTSQSSSSTPLSTLNGITQSLQTGGSTAQNVVIEATSSLTTNPVASSVLGVVSQSTGQLNSTTHSTGALTGKVKSLQGLTSPSIQTSAGGTSIQTSALASGGGAVQTPGLSGTITGSVGTSVGAHTTTPSSPATHAQVSRPAKSGGTVSTVPVYNPVVPTDTAGTPSLLPETGSNDPLWIVFGIAVTAGSFLWWNTSRKKVL